MSVEFHLPDVGEGLHEAEVVNWLVDVGDVVTRNQPFVEILTDKSTVELPAPSAGTVSHLGAAVGDIVTVGELLIVINTEETSAAPAPAAPAAVVPPVIAPPDIVEPTAEVRAMAPVATPPSIPSRSLSEIAGTPITSGMPVPDGAANPTPIPLSAPAAAIAAPPAEQPTTAPAPETPAPETPAPEPALAPPIAAPAPVAAPTATKTATKTLRPKASPSTRKLAAERGIDLATITGSGPGGRILAEDLDGVPAGDLAGALSAIDDALNTTSVLSTVNPETLETSAMPAAPIAAPSSAAPASAAATPQTAPMPRGRAADASVGQAEPGVIPLRGVRRLTANAMDRSWSTIPHITAMNEVEATLLLETRVRLRDTAGADGSAVTPLTLMMMAVAQALRAFPLVNATLDLEAKTITVHKDVNIGVAVSSPHGLIVPVVRNADTLSVLEMAAEIARLSAEARAQSISSSDLQGGTFTVTNYGSFGGRFASPIIRPGESGIIGFGGIAKRPIVIDDEVVARSTLPVVVAGDHRLIDGDLLSAFHNHVIAALADPTSILFRAAL